LSSPHLQGFSHINKIESREGAFCLIMAPSALGCAARDEHPSLSSAINQAPLAPKEFLHGF
jgi:hypothetical protein